MDSPRHASLLPTSPSLSCLPACGPCLCCPCPCRPCPPLPPCRFVLNSITGSDDPDAAALDLYSCTCLLGYALLPLVAHALVALLLPR